LCQKGVEIVPYQTTAATDYNFDNKYLKESGTLLKIIEQNRKWVQTIKKTGPMI
jgi:hypothetical protein